MSPVTRMLGPDPIPEASLRELVTELVAEATPGWGIMNRPLVLVVLSRFYPRPAEHLLSKWADAGRTRQIVAPHAAAARVAVPAAALVEAAAAAERVREIVRADGRVVPLRVLTSSAWAGDAEGGTTVHLLPATLDERDVAGTGLRGVRR